MRAWSPLIMAGAFFAACGNIIPNQWPGDITEGIFSAERMAQAVLDLEKAALEPAP